MRILLLGSTGLLSGAALAAFLDEGHDVFALSVAAARSPRGPRLAALTADRRAAREASAPFTADSPPSSGRRKRLFDARLRAVGGR
jgi:hypothetical protein